jgi:hypothetical protein
MIFLILFLLIISVPIGAQSQIIKANAGKKNIYINAGKVKGGQPTDGKDLSFINFGKHDTFERVALDIHEWTGDAGTPSRRMGPPAAIPCQFEVTYEEYPFRLFFDLEGIRWRSATPPNVSSSDYINNMYFIFSDSWGNERLAVTFNKPIEYEVFELHNPSRIVVDVKAGDISANKFPPVYSLRSRSSDDSDELRDLQYKLISLKNHDDYWGDKKEIPKGKKVRVLQSQDKKYFVEEGYYKTKQEALTRQKIFRKQGITLYIEKRKANEIPRAIRK